MVMQSNVFALKTNLKYEKLALTFVKFFIKKDKEEKDFIFGLVAKIESMIKLYSFDIGFA